MIILNNGYYVIGEQGHQNVIDRDGHILLDREYAEVCFKDIKSFDDSIESLRQIVKDSNLYNKEEFKKILTKELVYKIYFILKKVQ